VTGATLLRDRGLAAWREARYADALDHARAWIAAEPRSPQAHQLAGQAMARLGDPVGAARSYESAESLGGDVACAFNAGNAWMAAGDPARAAAAWRRAAGGADALGKHALALGKALATAGERALAAGVLVSLARRDPTAYAAMRAVVDLAAADRGAAATALSLEAPGPLAPPSLFSFVVCSIDEEKFAALSRTIATRFASVPHEVVRIPDATSLCEGYNRGFAHSRGDAVVYCHDDIDLLAPDAAPRLARHLTHADFVGVAGATRVTGPAVFWAGHPWLHGWVTYHAPGDADYEVTAMSLDAPLVTGIAALDGVFVACRRDAAAAVPYDEATFDGFHLYDLDVSYRAHRAGFRLAVACDLGIVHESKGDFGAEWSRYAARFRTKFPELSAVQGSPHFYAARVPTAADVLATQRRLAEFAAG
jgi:tetratricopeptide (TPR) repeat protein